MNTLPELKIKDIILKFPIVQGGMGAWISIKELTREVHLHGGLGVLSSAGLKGVYSLKKKRSYTTYEAVREEIETAMAGGYRVGINVMRILDESYDETIRAAIDAKVSAIFLGAGVPKLIENPGETAQVLIASSARTLKIILRRWRHRPDAVVLEGPKAGGHLGFKLEDVEKPEFALENILPEVLQVANDNGEIPVIVAGGVWDRADINKYLGMGASGVQMGTRFAATVESGASDEFKRQIVNCTKEDIIVVNSSPCGFPFRIIKNSPAYLELVEGKRHPKCRMGYVLGKDKEGLYTVCKAAPNNPLNKDYFCICDGLRAAIGLAPGEPPMYTVGANAYRVKEIISVAQLMGELTGNEVVS